MSSYLQSKRLGLLGPRCFIRPPLRGRVKVPARLLYRWSLEPWTGGVPSYMALKTVWVNLYTPPPVFDIMHRHCLMVLRASDDRGNQ